MNPSNVGAHIRDEVVKRLGDRINQITPSAATIFPNMSMLRSIARIHRTWQPKGPDKTEVRSAVFVDAAAPPEIKDAFRLAAIRSFGPSGSFEQGDMDNWEGCSMAGRGVVTRRHELNMSMGLGHSPYSEELLGWASEHRYSESNHRAFYGRWAELMDSRGWPS